MAVVACTRLDRAASDPALSTVQPSNNMSSPSPESETAIPTAVSPTVTPLPKPKTAIEREEVVEEQAERSTPSVPPTRTASPDPEGTTSTAVIPTNTPPPTTEVAIEAEEAVEEQTGNVTPTSTAASESEGESEAEVTEEEPIIERVISCHPPEGNWNVSIEERILGADVVAKVRLFSASGEVDTVKFIGPDDKVDTGPAPVLEFGFRVLEYLKGQGPDEIVAVASGYRYDSESQVRAILPVIVARRDTQWDDLDAIVFLRQSDDHVPSTLRPDRFYFSQTHYCSFDYYTIASLLTKKWLPAAGVHGDEGTGDQQQFLMDAPSGERTSDGYSPPPTITLGELKTRIDGLEEELNSGDGSEASRQCIVTKYFVERAIQKRIAETGTGTVSIDWNVASGLPAGSPVHVTKSRSGLSPNNTGRHWLEGPDFDLFTVETFDLTPYDWTSPGAKDGLEYSIRIATARPLPEGNYRFYRNHFWPERIHCEAISDLERTRNEIVVRSFAPLNVLHEAFFDPVVIGSAVGADGSSGILKPAEFTISGTETSVVALKWQDGIVTMKLGTSVSFAGHALEFIGLDGETVLTLPFDDAQTENGNGVLAWEVNDQLWEEGDLLMLRLRVDP